MSNHKGNIKHGDCGTLTYSRWKSMIARCYQTNADAYYRYGGRGITVCDQWRESFAAFLADMGECPSKEMTVERRDNDLGYTPDNCMWATKAEQNRNRSHCVELTHNGVTKILVDWAAEVGMTPNALAMRIRLGWSVERALTQPLKKRTVLRCTHGVPSSSECAMCDAEIEVS
jgi:ribosomal protein S25